MKQIRIKQSLIQLIHDIQNQEITEILESNIDTCIITSESYPNICIKPYFNDLKEEALSLIGSQQQVNIDLVDCDFIDFFVSTVVQDSETKENVFTCISLIEFISLQTRINKNFLFSPEWNLYI